MQPYPIRSFTRRQGKITSSQKQALSSLLPQYSLAITDEVADFDAIFQRRAPRILEIGFGGGENLISMAQQFPEYDFIGVDVHSPGIGKLVAALHKHNLTNVRVYDADVMDVFKCLPDASIAKILLFFPDPWPKRRHQKRRLVQTSFLEVVHRKLCDAGEFYLATDWQNYAEQMLEVLSACALLQNRYGAGNFAPRAPFRPLTKFEARGQKLGHAVWDLVFCKVK